MAEEVDDVETIKTTQNPTNSLIQNHFLDSDDVVHTYSPIQVAEEQKNHSSCRPFFGICLGILSSFAVIMGNSFAKLCKVIPLFEIAIIRFMIQLAITIPFLIYANDKMIYSPRITFFLFLRAFTGTSAMLARLYAVQNMPLGDATVLTFTIPVFAALFGRILLKEPLHRIYIFLLFLCLAGVVLIARPTFIFGHPDTSTEYENIWLPSLVAVGSSIIGAFSLISVRVLRKYLVKSSVLIFYHGIIGLVYSICGSYFERGFEFPFCKSIDYLYAVLFGICGYVIEAALNSALRFEKTFIVSLVRTSGIVMGFIAQVIVFALVPSKLSYGGAALITLSNVIIFIFNWKKSKNNRKA